MIGSPVTSVVWGILKSASALVVAILISENVDRVDNEERFVITGDGFYPSTPLTTSQGVVSQLEEVAREVNSKFLSEVETLPITSNSTSCSLATWAGEFTCSSMIEYASAVDTIPTNLTNLDNLVEENCVGESTECTTICAGEECVLSVVTGAGSVTETTGGSADLASLLPALDLDPETGFFTQDFMSSEYAGFPEVIGGDNAAAGAICDTLGWTTIDACSGECSGPPPSDRSCTVSASGSDAVGIKFRRNWWILIGGIHGVFAILCVAKSVAADQTREYGTGTMRLMGFGSISGDEQRPHGVDDWSGKVRPGGMGASLEGRGLVGWVSREMRSRRVSWLLVVQDECVRRWQAGKARVDGTTLWRRPPLTRWVGSFTVAELAQECYLFGGGVSQEDLSKRTNNRGCSVSCTVEAGDSVTVDNVGKLLGSCGLVMTTWTEEAMNQSKNAVLNGSPREAGTQGVRPTLRNKQQGSRPTLRNKQQYWNGTSPSEAFGAAVLLYGTAVATEATSVGTFYALYILVAGRFIFGDVSPAAAFHRAVPWTSGYGPEGSGLANGLVLALLGGVPICYELDISAAFVLNRVVLGIVATLLLSTYLAAIANDIYCSRWMLDGETVDLEDLELLDFSAARRIPLGCGWRGIPGTRCCDVGEVLISSIGQVGGRGGYREVGHYDGKEKPPGWRLGGRTFPCMGIPSRAVGDRQDWCAWIAFGGLRTRWPEDRKSV